MKKQNKKLIIVGSIILILVIILIAKINSSTSSNTQSNNILIDSYTETKNSEKYTDNINKSIRYDYIKGSAILEYPSENEEWRYNVYTDNTGTYKSKFVELTECKIDKNAISISIPDEIDGISVICMGDNLLSYYKNLKKLIIPNTIIYIGNKACYHCENLSDIKIPNSVTVIGDNAFTYHGFNISTFEIPNGVVEIGESAFYSYIGEDFEKVILPKSLEKIHYNTFKANEIIVLNPNLEFVTSDENYFVFNNDAIIYGYSGSTAAEYCAEMGNPFKVIEEN